MMASVKQEPADGGEPLQDPSGDQVDDSGGQSSSNHGETVSTVCQTVAESNAIQTRRRLSTRGIRRPGYKRRVSAPFSYVEFISMAIKASPNCMLTLREILVYLQENYECFQGSYVGWKNSVRHNLSSSTCFIKLLRNSLKPFGKDNFWAMNPDCPHCKSIEQVDRPSRQECSWQCESASTTPPPSLQLASIVNPLPEPLWQNKDTVSFPPPLTSPHPAQGANPSSYPVFTHQTNGPFQVFYPGNRSSSPIFTDTPIPTGPFTPLLPEGVNALPSSTFAQHPTEPSPTFLPGGGIASSPAVSVDHPKVKFDTPLPATDGNAVQSVPLDLSMPKGHAHYRPAIYRSMSPPRKPDQGFCGSLISCQEPTTIIGPTESRDNRHSLPISRFLNSPDDETCKESSRPPGSGSIPTGIRYSNVDRNTPDSTTSLVSHSIIVESTNRDSCKSSDTPEFRTPDSTLPRSTSPPWGSMSQDSVPKNLEELRMFQNLYKHYWNHAVQERDALYRQQLVMRSAASWPPMQYVQMKANIM